MMAFCPRRMLLLLWCLLLPLLASAESTNVNALEPSPTPTVTDEWTSPSVAAAQLDLADRMATELVAWTSELSEINELESKAVGIIQKTMTFIDQTGVTQANKKLRVTFSILNFVASVFLKSQTGYLGGSMMRRFQDVNQKLNGLHRQLLVITERLKVVSAMQEADEALSSYRDCHNAVRNGAVKLSTTLASMEGARTRHQLARLVEEFVHWYESSRLDELLANLQRVATRSSTESVGPNLFRSYAKLHGCSTSRLMDLMLGVVHDLEAGAELQLAYQFFRNGPERAIHELQRVSNNLYLVREVFDRVHWYCLENIDTVAASATRKLMEETTTMLPSNAANHILAELESRFNRFKWAVVVGVSELDSNSSTKSGNFFILPTSPQVLVMFAEYKKEVRCDDVQRTQTHLFFHCPVSTCSIATSSGIISSKSCFGVSTFGTWSKDLSWILIGEEKPCSSRNSSCSGNGECHHRPGLTQPICICHPEYLGSRCSDKDKSSAEFVKAIAVMRDATGDFAGFQTTVDVYYKILDVRSSLLNELRGLSACTDLRKFLSSDTFSETLYMYDIYSELLKNRLTLDQFGELMQTHVGCRNLEYLLKTMLKHLLGSNFLNFPVPGGGMVHLFKRCWATAHHQPVCSDRYSQSIQRLMTNLLLLDEAVGESLLTYFSWKDERTTMVDKYVLNYLVNEYKNRTNQLRDHWRAQSCPALETPDRPLGPGLAQWEQRFCNSSHSFEGLELIVSCTGQNRPRTAKITCQRGSDGRLAWSDNPQCDPV